MACFELYVSKLNPNNNNLWQKLKSKITGSENFWFDNVPVGRDTLNDAMKVLSGKAGLSQIYTNHCIRATTVTNLNDKGFEARDIMATTGHKSEYSIKAYASRCQEKKRRQMSDALAVSIIPPKCKATATITSEEVQSDSNTKENELFIDELEIPDDQIADILTQIEQENKQVMPQQQNSVLNLSNIQNVSN